MKFRPSSIRIRLTLWYAVSLAVIMIVLSSGTYFLMRMQLVEKTNERLERGAEALENVIVSNRRMESLFDEMRPLQRSPPDTSMRGHSRIGMRIRIRPQAGSR